MTKEYKGFIIVYNERDEIWECESQHLKDKSLKQICIDLDKLSVKGTDQYEVFFVSGRSLHRVHLTSSVNDKREAYITFDNGNRTKASVYHLYAITPESQEAFDQMETLNYVEKNIVKEREELMKKMQRIKL